MVMRLRIGRSLRLVWVGMICKVLRAVNFAPYSLRTPYIQVVLERELPSKRRPRKYS